MRQPASGFPIVSGSNPHPPNKHLIGQRLANIALAKTPSAQENFRRLADFYRDDRNRLVWWTVGLTLIAGFDAYVEAHLYDFRIDPELGTTPEEDGPALNITITFP